MIQAGIKTFLALFSISLIRYFVIAGIPFLLCYRFYSSWLAEAKIQMRKASNRDFIREILHSLQTTVILTFIGVIIMNTSLRKTTLVYGSIADHSILWLLSSVLLCLIIHDTYFYWMHRLLHHPLIFKFTHLLHHKSVNPSPWASYSFHFIEAWTEGAVLLAIVYLIPVHPVAIGAFVLSSFTINVYGHLGYEVIPLWVRGTLLFEVINTSVHHNMHHSKFKGNYGLYLRFWDRIMGTENPDYVKDFDRIQQKRIAAKLARNKQTDRRLNDQSPITNQF